MSLDLFAHVEMAARLRDSGMSLALAAQDSKDPLWSDAAYAAIVAAAKLGPTVHVDDVLAIFKVPPIHANAWGQIWRRAIKAGVLERTGTIKPCLSDPKKRLHASPIYRSTLYRQERAA